MNTLARYLELIVDPTFDEFHAKRDSIRLAFLTSVAIYHSVDRKAEETGKRAAHWRQVWCDESVEFKLMDIIAHHFKHVKSSDERILPSRSGIPIGFAMGFNETGDQMDLRNLYYAIRDAVRFVHRKCGNDPSDAPGTIRCTVAIGNFVPHCRAAVTTARTSKLRGTVTSGRNRNLFYQRNAALATRHRIPMLRPDRSSLSSV
jgi:hypothetical protein